ncbi:MAG: hypothetical protein HYX21_00155 [Candidatus Yanofskybacteria bacterium]|nr:hypothetical protein [Candidatus Yanofskybacteria bacterium]
MENFDQKTAEMPVFCWACYYLKIRYNISTFVNNQNGSYATGSMPKNSKGDTMKFSSFLLVVGIFAIFSFILQGQVEKLTAIQELQLRGYEQITVVDRVRFAAQFRTDCSFPEYAQLTFNAKHRGIEQAETVSVCISLWGDPTIHVP